MVHDGRTTHHCEVVRGNGHWVGRAYHTVHEDGPPDQLFLGLIGARGEAQVRGHDGDGVRETGSIDLVGGGAGGNGSPGFSVVGAHDGKGGESIAHHNPSTPELVSLEDLVIELGSDDRNALRREPDVGGQKACGDEGADLSERVVLVAVGHKGPNRW